MKPFPRKKNFVKARLGFVAEEGTSAGALTAGGARRALRGVAPPPPAAAVDKADAAVAVLIGVAIRERLFPEVEGVAAAGGGGGILLWLSKEAT